jgi:mycobactin peptide synthetase MbtE
LTESREQLVDAEYEPPQGPLESTVARIQAEILGVDRIGRSDSFYDFGGTSLQAIRICTRIEREAGRQAHPASLFEFDVLSEFVSRLPAPESADDEPALRPAPEGASGRLSEGQVAMWLDGLVRPERALGNVIVLAYRLSPAPDEGALLSAVRAFAGRHSALATAVQADADGIPEAVLLPPAEALLVDDSPAADPALQARAEALAQRVDLEGGPLAGVRVDPAAEGCELLLAVHHACFDGRSEALLSAELSALLRGESLAAVGPAAGAPAVPHRPDAAELADWGQRLAATRDISWPTMGPDDQPGTEESGAIRFETSANSSAGLTRQARAAGVSPFHLVLRAVGRAIRDSSGTDHFCLGIPVSIRDIESDNIAGNFVRQAVVPVGAAELDGPLDALAATWRQAQAAIGIGVSELAKLAGRGAADRSRLFQVQFAWQNQPIATWDIPGVAVSELEVGPITPQLDLTVELRPAPGGSVSGLIEYDAKVVPSRAAATIARRLRSWFDEVAAA